MGRGTFQIDLGGNPGVSQAQAFNPSYSSNFAANMLSTNGAALAAQHPNFNGAQLAQATAASYNMGLGKNGKNFSGNPNTIDVGTTGEIWKQCRCTCRQLLLGNVSPWRASEEVNVAI